MAFEVLALAVGFFAVVLFVAAGRRTCDRRRVALFQIRHAMPHPVDDPGPEYQPRFPGVA